MFMQAGFMLVETGLCRAKNSAHTAGNELDDLSAGLPRLLGLRLRDRLGQLVEWTRTTGLVSVAWSRSFDAERRLGTRRRGRCGGKRHRGLHLRPDRDEGFFLTGVDDTAVMTLFFFMMVFMDTTATIPTGAMAERWAWKNFCLFGSVGRAAVLLLCELGVGRRLAWLRRV